MWISFSSHLQYIDINAVNFTHLSIADNTTFILVFKTVLPPAYPGPIMHQLPVEKAVRIGDVIGIHYNMFADNPVIPSSRKSDGDVPEPELINVYKYNTNYKN